jgi:hypothetical protein
MKIGVKVGCGYNISPVLSNQPLPVLPIPMETDGKCGALTQFAGDGDLPMVRLNDFLDDGQAQADPA